jgi:hypothetical protein
MECSSRNENLHSSFSPVALKKFAVYARHRIGKSLACPTNRNNSKEVYYESTNPMATEA